MQRMTVDNSKKRKEERDANQTVFYSMNQQ
jgi:hypothetical protein